MNDVAAPAEPAAEPAESEEQKPEPLPEEPGSEARIRAALRDPLSEARSVEDVIAAAQAYESFQRNVTAAGPLGVAGLAIGSTFHFHSTSGWGSSRAFDSGPVRAEELARIGEWYAAAPSDPELRSALGSDHLVVMAGAAGSGRSTTALRLLAEFAPERVHRASSRLPLNELDEERIAQGHGYVAEAVSDQPLTEADLDAFAAKLKKRGAYWISIPAPENAADFSGHYLHQHRAPEARAIYTRRVAHFERTAHAQDDPELAEALRRLAADSELADLLGPDPEPSDEVGLAEVILDIAGGRSDRAEVLENGGGVLDRRIEVWLARLPEGVELQKHQDWVETFALRVALAVLNDSPVNLVWDAGARLAWEIYTTAEPRLTPGRAVFSRLDEELLAQRARARLRDGTVKVADTAVPAQLLAYQQPAMAVKLLAAVWAGRPNLRRPLIRWLQDLSEDRRPDVWMRAALAIGLVTSWDFAFSYHEAMEPWVGSESPRHRLVAATALDQAARDDRIRDAVKALLRQWTASDNRQQLWTAALVLKYDTGARDIRPALRMLRRIGLWHDGDIAGLAAGSVAELFTRGRFDDVLDTVDGWIADPRLDHHVFGLTCSMRLALLRVRELLNLDELPLEEADRRWLTHPDRAGWPLAVALAQVSGRLGRNLAECVWQVLAGSLAANVMRDEIAAWIRAAESDPGLLGPLTDFLGKLIDGPDDEARLLDVVAVLATDPDDPLSEDTAAALVEALRRRGGAVDPLMTHARGGASR